MPPAIMDPISAINHSGALKPIIHTALAGCKPENMGVLGKQDDKVLKTARKYER